MARAGLNPGAIPWSNGDTMNPNLFLRGTAVCAVLFAAGCASTPAQRIAGSKEFDTYPSAIQEKIIDGKVDVGFTAEQVRLALGRPDRVSRRQTSSGDSEVWSYDSRKPHIAFSFGVASGGRHSSTAAGVMVGDRSWRDEEWIRVVMKDGVVTAVERRQS